MTLLLLLRPHGASVAVPEGPFSWDDAGETPDELEQPLVFTVWLAKSTGELVDILDELTQRQIQQQLNLPTGFTITMRMDDRAYPFALLEQAPRLKVFRASTPAELAADPLTVNQLVFYGTLPSEGVQEDAKGGLAQLSFQDPMWVLNQRFVQTSTSFAQVDQGLILWQIIDAQNALPNGDTFIREGSVLTGTLRDRTYDAGKQVADLIQEMTQVDGGCDVAFQPVDYWELDGTDAMGTFNAYPQRGQDRPGALFVYAAALEDGTDGGLKSNVGNMVRTRAKTITKATSVGSADTQVYQNTTSPYGLLEDWETFSDVSISQTLLDKSVGKVANAQNAPMIIEVSDPTIEAPVPLIDYLPGDTVYATCRRGGMAFFSLPVRVHGIDITIDQNGAIVTKPTLATLPETIVAPTLPDGGGVGSGGGTLGTERVTAPTHGTLGTVVNPDSDIAHGSDIVVSLAGASPSVVANATGSINGLVVGQDYVLTVLARGNDAAPVGGGSRFLIWIDPASPIFGGSGSVASADDHAHIWNATLAVRQALVELTVEFTATATSLNCGIVMTAVDAGVKVYTTAWSIAPA